MPSSWVSHGSQSLYRIHEDGSDLSQTEEDQISPVLVAESPEALKSHMRKEANLLEELGFLLNKKCIWTPTQRREFLRFKVDPNTMHLFLPEDQEGMQECDSSRPPGSQKASSSDWPVYLYNPSDATSTTTLPCTAAPQEESIKRQSPLLQPSG